MPHKKLFPHFRSRVASSRRGAVMLETVIALTVFAGTMFMSIDLGRIGLELMTLHSTVKQAARWGSMGVVTDGLTREQTIQNRAKQLWQEWGMSPDSLTVNINTLPAGSELNNVIPNKAGTRGDYLIVEGTLTTSMGSFLGILSGSGGGQTIQLKARGITRNE